MTHIIYESKSWALISPFGATEDDQLPHAKHCLSKAVSERVVAALDLQMIDGETATSLDELAMRQEVNGQGPSLR